MSESTGHTPCRGPLEGGELEKMKREEWKDWILWPERKKKKKKTPTVNEAVVDKNGNVCIVK